MNTTTTLTPPAAARPGLLTTLRAWTQDFAPILSTLRRHKIAAGLIVLEVALTCTIVTNALHMIQTRAQLLSVNSGLAEAELGVLNARGSRPQDPLTFDSRLRSDLAALRALPGVKSAIAVNQHVFGGSSNNSGVSLSPDKQAARVTVAQYASDEYLLPTFGLQLLEGRNFRSDEIHADARDDEGDDARIGVVLINKVLADKFFPGRSALGQRLYGLGGGDAPVTVIGVVGTLTHPYLHKSRRQDGYAVVVPVRSGGSYVVRTEPAQMDAVLKAASRALEQNEQGRVVTSSKPLTQLRDEFFAQDRAMAWLMGGVCAALLLVTAMGIVGLASFWVQQRTRMIGTRRALGATQAQILRYFLLENLLLTTTGILIGLAGALGLSQLLMQSYALPRLPWVYLPAGALTLWALGQLAVWVPARRAARLSPVAALRA